MSTVSSVTNPYSNSTVNSALANYSTGLAVINQSTSTSGSSSDGSAAYALGGNLAFLNQLNSASGANALQTLQSLSTSGSTSNNGLPALSSYLNSPMGLQLLSTMGTQAFEYMSGSSATQTSGLSTTPTSSSGASSTDQFNPANPFGDAIQSQMGDSQLYAMDPSLLAIANAAYTSSQQSTATAGSTVDTSA